VTSRAITAAVIATISADQFRPLPPQPDDVAVLVSDDPEASCLSSWIPLRTGRDLQGEDGLAGVEMPGGWRRCRGERINMAVRSRHTVAMRRRSTRRPSLVIPTPAGRSSARPCFFRC
jgi:hypothetical protein